MGRELSVVIPTYNEKKNIRILVPKILNIFNDHDIDGEIIIVDDQSTDGSRIVLKELEAKIHCLRIIFRDPPRSLSRSWFEGFNGASKENIVCIDADLCHDPKYFPQMLDRLESFDIVIGSRYLHRRWRIMEGKSLFPGFASIIGQYLTRISIGLKESDISHSFRMFKKEVFLSIKEKLKQEGNTFLIEYLYHAKRHGYRITEIPIQYGKRIHGRTKLKVSKEGMRYLKFITKIFFKRLFGNEKILKPNKIDLQG